jgi:ribosomal protein S6
MSETTHADNMSVYEIGFLIAPSVPEEKIPGEAEAITKIVTSAGASVIAEEAPHRTKLAYEMRKKNVGGTYEKYKEAYFGWTKFEAGSDGVEAIKKAIEAHPSILRMLLISTVRENTYLGKRAPAIAAELSLKKEGAVEKSGDDKKEPVAPVSIEEMDKSIDEMVKEA